MAPCCHRTGGRRLTPRGLSGAIGGVIDGTLTVQLRDRDVTLRPGQVFVVPRGVEHCPRAEGEVKMVLL